MWFNKLMGFYERNPQQVKTSIEIKNDKLISKINQAAYTYGQLEISTLEKLKEQYSSPLGYHSKITVSEVIADIQTLHKAKENNGALFQVASQFNLLEMASPTVTPERGVGIYEGDHTQGPACAVACGAGTIYRNYFTPVNGKIGQTENNQINCLDAIEKEFGSNKLWTMQNGYLFTTQENLKMISKIISGKTPEEYEKLKGKLKTGIQWGTEVTLPGTKNFVTQIYCAALPVRYNDIADAEEWEIFARLILEATYEATFYAALQNYKNTGNNRLFLTLVGGGVFGNKKEWILDAIKKSVIKFSKTPLDVRIVSYLKPNPAIHVWINELKAINY
jgi:hypothetical protein